MLAIIGRFVIGVIDNIKAGKFVFCYVDDLISDVDIMGTTPIQVYLWINNAEATSKSFPPSD